MPTTFQFVCLISFIIFLQQPVYSQFSDSSFSKALELEAGANPTGIAAGDIDGDGKLDLVVTNYDKHNGYTISVYENTSLEGSISKESFGNRVDLITFNRGPHRVVFGDLDGNRLEEFAVACMYGQGITIYKYIGDSKSPFDSSDFKAIKIFTDFDTWGLLLEDLDGDGYDDLMVLEHNDFSPGLYIYPNKFDGLLRSETFPQMFGLETKDRPRDIAAGDLNGDGKPEIVLTNNWYDSVLVFINDCSKGNITAGSFNKKYSYGTNRWPWGVVLADIDYDGKDDIVTANAFGGISILHNEVINENINSESFGTKISLDSNLSFSTIAAADFDCDQRVDLLAGHLKNGFYLYRNITFHGTIAFEKGVKYESERDSQIMKVVAADLDGDGGYDFAGTSYWTDVYLFRNQLNVSCALKTPVINSIESQKEDKIVVNLYPNPFTHQLTIAIPADLIGCTAEIFDLTGKNLISQPLLIDKPSLDLSHLNKGMYFYRISNGDKVITGKLLKK